METVFLTEDELLHSENCPKSLTMLFCGSQKNITSYKREGYIPYLMVEHPDKIIWDGCETLFISHKHKGRGGRYITYIISSCEMIDEEQDCITEFFRTNFDTFDYRPSRSWDDFYNAKYAIAYRGGSGYSYSIHIHPKSPKFNPDNVIKKG